MASRLCVPKEQMSPPSAFKKPKSSRAHLELPLSPDSQSESSPPIQIKSAQNSCSRRFIFPTDTRCREILTALQRLHALQGEKSTLLKELRSLREGALNAIIEKDEAIDRLRQKIEEAESNHSRDSQDIARDETYVAARIQQARQQREELLRERHELSQQHIQQIIRKDHQIVELGEQLEQVKSGITSFEIRDRSLTEDLHRIEEETEGLHDELLRSRSSMSEMRDSLNGSAILSCSLNKSMASSPERKFSATLHHLQTEQSKEHDSKHSWSYQKPTVEILLRFNEEQKERHRRELEHLRIFYEDMLAASTSQIQRNLTIPVEQNEEQSATPSLRSFKESEGRSQRVQPGYLRNEIQLIVEPTINIFGVDIDNPQKRVMTNASIDQCESQFSYKHFQYDLPNRQVSTENSTTLSKLRTDNNLTVNEAIRLANQSTYSRHSRSGSMGELNASTRSKRPLKVASPEHVLEKPGVKYGIFVGGILVSFGVLYAVYRNRS